MRENSSTPEQRIAADLGLTVADLERIVRDERARKRASRLVDTLGHIYTVAAAIWGCNPEDTCMREARALLAEIDRPINT